MADCRDARGFLAAVGTGGDSEGRSAGGDFTEYISGVDECDAAREESGGTSNDVLAGAAEDRPGIDLDRPFSDEGGLSSSGPTLILGSDESPFMLDTARRTRTNRRGGSGFS